MNYSRNIKENFTFFIKKSEVSVGRFTYGFDKISIRQWGEGASLTIGQFCSISSNVTIFLGGNHRVDWLSTFPFGHIFLDELGSKTIPGHPSTNGNVVIGNDVWIGHGVTIMSGVNIGDGAVVAANTHVIKDVKPYEIVGGNPSRTIKKRFDRGVIELLLKLKWWDFPLEEIKKIIFLLSDKPNINDLSKLLSKYNRAS
jgi:acetyltransferase-like isoleucine patch superfamily enzyme